MKKILLALFAITSITAAAEVHVYGKVGADIYSRYNKIETAQSQLSTSGKARGYSLMLEATKDFTPNTEVGVGLGYIRRISKRAGKPLKTPSYDTIPLYATAKYNIDGNGTWKPYVKADLGIAFNDSSSTLEFDWYGVKAGKSDLDVGHGVYAGVGVGAEYNNFVADLSYHITTAKAKGSYEGTIDNNTTVKGEFNYYNNHAITLAVGYKFDF